MKIMLSPLWVSHSRHAVTHERHPMHRDGSRKMRFTAIGLALLFSLGSNSIVPVGRIPRLTAPPRVGEGQGEGSYPIAGPCGSPTLGMRRRRPRAARHCAILTSFA